MIVILTVKITLMWPLERIVTICYLLCRGKDMKKEFEAWCNRKKVKQITEEVVLVYIRGWKSTSVAEG
jgi:hypothetical protein